jgi:hypothetical protein
METLPILRDKINTTKKNREALIDGSKVCQYRGYVEKLLVYVHVEGQTYNIQVVS